MKLLLKVIAWTFGMVLAGLAVFAGGFLLFSILTEYRPPAIGPVPVEGTPSLKIGSTRVFSLITWNIGYGGLGKEMDFFYDGGKQVRPERSSFEKTFSGIRRLIGTHDTADFILLQEVDTHSKRSYYTDEVSLLAGELPSFVTSFAVNYDCRFVPVPLSQPMGRVTSGLMTCSRFLPAGVTRYGFDVHTGWPSRLFYLKRCFAVSRFSLPGDRQLVLVNIHNSAFDTGGTLRQREMEMIGHFMISEYEAGNYLVAGGDWNANPPGFNPGGISTGDRARSIEFSDLSTFLPGWEFVYDPMQPTNRDVNTGYVKGSTPVTVIDFFLVSPNIRVLDVQTIPTGFEDSDHQPVSLTISIDPAP